MTETPAANHTTSAETPGSTVMWCIAFFFFPYGSFLYMAYLKITDWCFAVSLAVLSAAAHMGMVSVLSETNGEPWQVWLVYLLGALWFAFGAVQYSIGARKGIWGPKALRSWRIAGWFFGMFMLLTLLANITFYHLVRLGIWPAWY